MTEEREPRVRSQTNEVQFFPFLAVCPRANKLTSLSLSFLIFKVRYQLFRAIRRIKGVHKGMERMGRAWNTDAPHLRAVFGLRAGLEFRSVFFLGI